MISKDLDAVAKLIIEASITFNWICEGSWVGTSRSANSASKLLEIKLEAGHSELLTSTDMLKVARLDQQNQVY